MRVPRSNDWECLDGPLPNAEDVRPGGEVRATAQCRLTGLTWHLGYWFERGPEPFTTLAPEGVGAFVRFAHAGNLIGEAREVARVLESHAQWASVAEVLGPEVRRRGPLSISRRTYLRACRRMKRWSDIERFLRDTVASDQREPDDVAGWLYACERSGVGLPDGALELVLREVERWAWVDPTRAETLAEILDVNPEPALFLTLPALFLRVDQRKEGRDVLRHKSLHLGHSLMLPFGWAVLEWVAGLDPEPPLSLVRERARRFRSLAQRPPFEAVAHPLFWSFLPESHHETAAEVMVALGARSVFDLLADAAIGQQRLEE